MRAASNEGEDSRGKDIDSHHCKNHLFLVQSSDRKQRQRRRAKARFSIHSILLGLFWIAASFENRYGFPFVMRNSWISPAMGFSHSIARTLKRRGSILPFGGNGFCLYSSNLDGFFEKGGDMDQLMEELAENQNQPNQFNNNNNKTATEWIDAQDLLSLVGINERETDPSPVEIKEIRNKRVYVKQDDQLRLSGSGISGNKARKMWTLNEIPAHQFPSCLVSYGGPQSNSMLALAAVANYKNRELLLNNNKESIDENVTNSSSLPVRFVYYTKKLPRFLRKQPNGNFFRALSLGMELVEVSHEEYARLFEHPDTPALEPPAPNSLWVPQGGAFAPARKGAQKLAQEIAEYWSETSPDRPLTVCVPGGTCTTALLLHHELQQLLDSTATDIQVVVVPCVGDASYARRQMMSLSAQIGASPDNIPTILPPQPEHAQSGEKDAYFTFGKPDKAILDTFQELQETSNLFVDLLYGAPSFAILLRHWGDEETSTRLSPDLAFDPKQPLEGREIMYVHSGGLEGINSQMLRYKYNGLVEIKDVQLPGRQNRSKPTRRGNKKKQQPQ